MTKKTTLAAAAGLAAAVSAGAAAAGTLQITVTNNQPDGGLYLTPFLFAVHDGSYDLFNPGEAASPGLEALAEDGVRQVEIDNNPDTRFVEAAGGPVAPGASFTTTINVDEDTERFLTFGTMVIPSNDSFLGNPNPIEIFDASGVFSFGGPIELFGAQVWDAGTELNDGQGAAFSTAGGVSTPTDDTVQLETDLSFLLGTPIVPGGTIQSVPGPNDLIATIEVALVPLPAGLPLAGAGLGALWLLRRRAKA